MNARALNTLPRRLVAVLATLSTLAAVAGCGGGGASDVPAILRQAFHPSTPISSGRLDLSFGLTATGVASARQPFALHVQGPFQGTGSGRLPRFDLGVTLTAGGRTVDVGATATGSQLFLKVQGVPYLAPDSIYQQVKQGYAQSASATASRRTPGTFASLGIDPQAWLVHPRNVGTVTLAGVPAVHVSAGLDVPRFLSDLGRVSSAGSSFGLGAGLTPAQRSALSQSVSSARVDVYAARDDHVLRQLGVHAVVAATGAASAALGGLRSGTLDFTLAFSDVNRPQPIGAPAHAQPLSNLAAALGATGGVGTGGVASAPPGSSGGAGASGGSGATSGAGGSAAAAGSTASQQAYLQCVQRAGQDLEALQACGSLLHG